MDFSDENKRRIAFHEAGHAWMMWKVGLGVKSVSMEPHRPIPGDNRGETVPNLAMEEGRNELSRKFAKAALAGSAAEHFLLGKWDEESLLASSYDQKTARDFMVRSGDQRGSDYLDHEVHALFNSAMSEISRPREWDTVMCLAYALLASGSLTGEQVLEIFTGL